MTSTNEIEFSINSFIPNFNRIKSYLLNQFGAQISWEFFQFRLNSLKWFSNQLTCRHQEVVSNWYWVSWNSILKDSLSNYEKFLVESYEGISKESSKLLSILNTFIFILSWKGSLKYLTLFQKILRFTLATKQSDYNPFYKLFFLGNSFTLLLSFFSITILHQMNWMYWFYNF